MYVPPYFRVENRSELLSFIEREPFGILVSTTDGTLGGTHVPFVILEKDDGLKLGLHVAKANPQWRNIEAQPVLAIFHGAHAMVSASWYAQPQASVPTWNYSAVHCTGHARLADATAATAILERIVERFEPSWRMDAADPAYIAAMQKGIVAIELTVASITGAFKHSQNRSAEDRDRVIRALSDSNDPRDRLMAGEMQFARARRQS